MKIRETYYRGDEPLGYEYEVLKVDGNYAYLGHFNGDCCKMVACHMPTHKGNWYSKRSDAIKARMGDLSNRAESYRPHFEKYILDEAANSSPSDGGPDA